MRAAAASLLAAVVALAAPGAAGAATYKVTGGDGACGGADLACGTISAAAAAAGTGDTVLISPGTYSESAEFGSSGVTVRGSTDAPGVVVTGTLTFSGDGATPSVLEKLIVAAPAGGAPAVALSGGAGTAIRDAVVIGADGSGASITDGGANAITRTSVLTAAAGGKAVDIQPGAASVGLALDSSILSGGASGIGLAVKTGVGTIPVGGGTANISARHITIAGAPTGISLDASAATGLLTPTGNIAATVTDSIVQGANPTRTNSGLIPIVFPPNSATLTLTRTDQATPADALFANPARRNYHLRADAPVIDKGQVTAGDSATDIDGQPRTSGTASDLGADEFVDSAPTAMIALKTASPRAGQPVLFDGSGSSDREAGAGDAIVEYRWTFGDGTTQTTTTPTVEHAYGAPGAAVAQLVVVDRAGAQSDPASVDVQLANGTPPTVVITKPKSKSKFALKRKGRRTTISFAGTATATAGVKGVVLTIERLGASKKTCTWIDKKKGLVKSPCAKPVLINAKLRKGGWTYTVARSIKLTKGTYRASAYGIDNGGAFGNASPASKHVIRFTLR